MKDAIYEMHENINEKYPFIYNITILENNFSCCPNWHDNIEILCMIDGECEVTLDSATFNVRYGDTVVVNSGCVHKLSAVGGTAAYHCIILDRDFCKFFGFDTKMQYLQEKISDSHINDIFVHIASELKGKGKHYIAAVKHLAGELMVHLYRNYSISGENIYDNSSRSITVKKAAVYIDENCTHNLSIDEIAASVNVSKYYLCRIFKEVMGITMVDYVNFRRCKKAKRMIENDNASIAEIAEACGFENMSYFSKIYKKYMNILPSEQKKKDKAVKS